MVTGATGYVAGVLVKELLKAGLTVHCAIRDPNNLDKIQHLTDAAATLSQTPDNNCSLKFFAADLMKDGSYMESMQGCTVVFHTASPFFLNTNMSNSEAQKQLLDPAVHGVENVLKSVAQTPSVRRVVLTSSCYAVLTDAADCKLSKNGITNEEIWNSTASIQYIPYAYSKKLAEERAWEMSKEHGEDNYKLITILPSFVMGPGLKVHSESESYKFITALGGGVMKNGCPDMGLFLVDVQDVAQAHIKAAFTP